jgi:hypothetical protein
MSAPQIYSRHRTISASLLLETLGASLGRIKAEDGATFADLGAVLGKSDDRAAAYSLGNGDMGVVSFLRGVREWDGRFANDALGLVGMRVVPCPSVAASREDLLKLLGRQSQEASELTVALCGGLADGSLSSDEARKARLEAEQLLTVVLTMIAELQLIEREGQ